MEKSQLDNIRNRRRNNSRSQSVPFIGAFLQHKDPMFGLGLQEISERGDDNEQQTKVEDAKKNSLK